MKTLILYPPKFMTLFTGAMACEKTATHATLIYTDGQKEKVSLSDLPTVDWEDWISIVSGIQSLRKVKP